MTNHYLNLMFQVDKLHRNNRQGSYKTRARYYEAMQRFCCFLAEVYRLEWLANIAPKHIYAYVAYLQEQEKSASTIKADLSAIRFSMTSFPTPDMSCRGTETCFSSAEPSATLTGHGAMANLIGC